MKRLILLLLSVIFILSSCSQGNKDEKEFKETLFRPDYSESSLVVPEKGISETVFDDYLIIVNKDNRLPEGYEDRISLIETTNPHGETVYVESLAYNQYLLLRESLEKGGITINLDSAYRSVNEQQEIYDSLKAKHGENYVAKYVALPGFSEHHTGLAIDIHIYIDGEDVCVEGKNESYPEIWKKIHEKLADFGFILRYIKGKEDITGYSYEPWHIRYIGLSDTAKEITEKGLTLEEYLAAKRA